MSFPDFKKIELSDKSRFYDFTKPFLPYSDFNFTSIWSYSHGEASYCILNDNLVIALPDYNSEKIIYSFLGVNKTEETLLSLFEFLKNTNNELVLDMVPEVSIKNNEQYIKSRYLLEEDRDNFDYILSCEKMATLEGGIFHHQRNEVKHFQKEAVGHEVIVLDLQTNEAKKDIVDLCYVWGTRKKKTEEEIEREIEAIRKVLADSQELNIFGIGIYVQERMIAFFIVEIINEKYAIGHFRKADTQYHGIFTYVDHQMAKMLHEKKIEYFNFEQDMGIESLRKAKESWEPVFYLKKYKITKT